MTRLAWNEMSSKSRQFLPWQSALYLEPQLALKIRVRISRTIWITCDLLVDAFVVDHVLLRLGSKELGTQAFGRNI